MTTYAAFVTSFRGCRGVPLLDEEGEASVDTLLESGAGRG